jgi:DnaJ-domain-containing protein 1
MAAYLHIHFLPVMVYATIKMKSNTVRECAMNTSQQPKQSLVGLLWDTLRLSIRLLWKSSTNPVLPVLQRQQALAVLGLPPHATPQQIKHRYRTLAKKYHPDLGGDPQQMQRLSAAYELLMKEQTVH